MLLFTAYVVSAVALAGVTHFRTGGETVCLQQGTDSYASAWDTDLDENEPSIPRGDLQAVAVDSDDFGSLRNDGLIRFEGLFDAGRVPLGSHITSATLSLYVLDPSGISTDVHRVLRPWSECDTWSAWPDGAEPDGVNVTELPDVVIEASALQEGWVEIDVTVSAQAWADGAAQHGWVLLAGDESDSGWSFASSEATATELRPRLCVEYQPRSPADYNGDGVCNTLDVLDFLNDWVPCGS